MEDKPNANDPVREVAEAIADGRPVDWDALGTGDDCEGERLEKLRIVERVANAYQVEHSQPLHAAGSTNTVPDEASITEPDGRAGEGAVGPAAAAETPLFTWGPLRVLQLIGRGAFADVYRAYDPSLRLEVALKLQRLDVPLDERSQKRFQDEARKLARVRHDNVLTVHGVGVHDGRFGIWTQLVRGKTLAACVEEQGPFGDEATCMGMKLCGALAALHNAGLVHRDLKPTNVMREEGGRIILMDFGSACAALPDPADARHTVTGTPLTTAPEVLLHREPPKPVQDIYGLGVLLYWMVSNRYPVEAKTLDELVRKHQRGQARTLVDVRPDVAPATAHVIERALAPRAEDRYQTAGEMQRALTAALGARSGEVTGRRVPSRSLLLVMALAAVAVVSVAAIVAPRLRPAPQVQAALYREDAQSEARLADGGHIRPSEQLFMEILVDRPMYVWVINEDESGHAWVLYPIEKGDRSLEPGRLHRLPGDVGGALSNWGTSNEAGRETILVVAATEHLASLDQQLAGLPRAGSDATSEEASSGGDVPRGITHVVRRTPGTNGRGVIARLLQEYGDKQGRGGVWLWKLQLVNDGS
jgi:tRNA A-37 threonylcarbamoyl transferase component Bud32